MDSSMRSSPVGGGLLGSGTGAAPAVTASFLRKPSSSGSCCRDGRGTCSRHSDRPQLPQQLTAQRSSGQSRQARHGGGCRWLLQQRRQRDARVERP